MLNSAVKEPDVVDENCCLFSLEELLLLIRLDPKSEEVKERTAIIKEYIEAVRDEDGYFQNIRGITTGTELYLSHDNMRAYCIFSKIEGLSYHKDIWKKIKSGRMTYDNLTKKPNMSRLVHPRDFIYIGYINGNIICWLLMPIYYAISMVTFSRDTKTRPTIPDSIKLYFKNKEWPKRTVYRKTDNELLYWVQSHIDKHPLRNLFSWLFNKVIKKRFGSWRALFAVYFVPTDHPINTITSKLKTEDLHLKDFKIK